MKTRFILFLVLLAGVSAFHSCTKYPPDSSRVSQDLAIYTKYDISVNFNNYSTYAIVPKVAYIDGKDTSYLTNAQAMSLLNRIAADMNARGFLQVADSTFHPDLGINVTAIKSTNTSVYYPGWYWGYPGYYPPGWWGYPGYNYYYPYYPAYITSYSTGTVIIDLADLKYPQNNRLMIRWNAYIRGLLNGSHSTDDVLRCVDQAFDQTPALKTTPLSN